MESRNIASPGDAIGDMMDDKHLTVEELAAELGITFDETMGLFKGITRITDELAMKLARILGGSKGFWLGLEEQYRANSAMA